MGPAFAVLILTSRSAVCDQDSEQERGDGGGIEAGTETSEGSLMAWSSPIKLRALCLGGNKVFLVEAKAGVLQP